MIRKLWRPGQRVQDNGVPAALEARAQKIRAQTFEKWRRDLADAINAHRDEIPFEMKIGALNAIVLEGIVNLARGAAGKAAKEILEAAMATSTSTNAPAVEETK